VIALDVPKEQVLRRIDEELSFLTPKKTA
jgi:hypothetical protein